MPNLQERKIEKSCDYRCYWHGKVAADIAAALGWTKIEFFDSSWPERDESGQWPIVGKDTEIPNFSKL